MKVDLRDDGRRHCGLQLEVAALAARSGYTVAFEQKLKPGMPPSDVVLTHGPESLRVETFAVVQGKKSQEAAAYWESMSSHIMVAELRHNVSLDERLVGVTKTMFEAADPYHAFAGSLFASAASPTSPLNPFSAAFRDLRAEGIGLFARVIDGCTPRVPSDIAEELPFCSGPSAWRCSTAGCTIIRSTKRRREPSSANRSALWSAFSA
jgi:hypothetical protein